MRGNEYRPLLQQARRLWREGYSFDRIARRLGGHPDLWLLLAEQCGEMPEPAIPEAVMEKVRQMRAERRAYSYIAEKTGYDASEIEHAVNVSRDSFVPEWDDEAAWKDYKNGLTIKTLTEKYGYPSRDSCLKAMEARRIKKEKEDDRGNGVLSV